MSKPALSVIIPVYNVDKYLEKCLDSVLAQSFKELEVLLINDGSTDGSESICNAYVHLHPDLFRCLNKKNEGQGPSRDLGVKLAKGMYITFLDADDWWEPEYCVIMMNAAEQYKPDIVVCDICYAIKNEFEVEKKISEIRLAPNRILSANDDPDIINRVRTFLWGKVYKRELYVSINLQQAGHPFQDFPITTALAASAKRICRVDIPLYNYTRFRQDSVTNNFSNLYYLKASIIDMINNFKKIGFFDKYYWALEKMAFSQIRFVLIRLNKIEVLFDEKPDTFKAELFQIMKHYFPSWRNPCNYKIRVNGSTELYRIISLLLFDEAACLNREQDVDYIFTDSLEYINSVKNYKANRTVNKTKLEFVPIQKNEIIDEARMWDIADLLWYRIFSGKIGETV